MAVFTKNFLGLFVATLFLSSCQFYQRIEERAKIVNNFEKAALQLARENRELKAQISSLSYQLETVKSQKNYLEMQQQKNSNLKREVASVAPVVPENDLVNFNVYRWKASQLLAVGQKEFEMKNYEKSAQYYQTFLKHYGRPDALTDALLFQSGLAAYEAGAHFDWASNDFEKLIEVYPTSSYYKGAKLWWALSQLKQGNESKFFAAVEEFRKKYRNTQEWEIIKSHYETILHKHKK